MKLVDILARELKVWPADSVTAVQDLDGEVKFDHSHEMPRINKSKDVWIRHGDQGDSIYPEELAEDCSHAIVTRAQWQAAVDALKKPKAIEWKGGGLPPVGTVCECKFIGQPDCHFTRVTIRYISDKHVVVFGEVETSHNVAACVFRSIRTPEQIAAEERLNSMLEMIRAEPAMTTCMAANLYDAGYRKFEIVEGE